MTLSLVAAMAKLFLSVGSPARVYPRATSLILVGAIAVVLGAAAGCGGGGKKHPAERIVRGGTFAFRAPFDWKVTRTATEAQVAPSPGAPELAAVKIGRASCRERVYVLV